jgi:hypothetical protein
MRKVDTNVKELVGMIKRGELRLPEMQRRYIWRAPRVRDLLDSLYRNYPSGTILVWETDQEQPSRDLAVSQQTSPFSGHKLLLDGQQRLTSLSAVLRGEPIKVRGRKREIDILFNLEHPENCHEATEVVEDEESPLVSEDEQTEAEIEEEEEEIDLLERLKRMTFVVSNNRLLQQPSWVSVAKVFKSSSDTEILKQAGITSFDDPRYAKYSTRLQKLRAIENYPYTMQVLPRELSYEEVAEIFVRVNSLGVKLRGSDLALAQITAKWPNSLKLLEEFQDECEEGWMTLDLGLLVRAMVVFATGQSRFDRVSMLSVKKLQEGWEKAKDGIRFACNFLRTNADIEDESLLSSPLFFIVIAYYSQRKNENFSQDEIKNVLYWLHIANARGRYSRGSSETLLDADLNTITKGGGAIELIETVRQQFGRINLEPTDFIGRGAGSPLFSLVFLALKAQGAKDWNTGLGLSLTHQGRYHYIQYHHIFPKSLLKGEYEIREINEIANMAFISGKTNRKISDKEPSVYLPRVITENGTEALKLQGVPLDRNLYQIDRYRDFLQERRSILSDTVNDFLQSILK